MPAAQFVALSIGDRLTNDNFSNRGNIEVVYVAGTDVITVEMQRFTDTCYIRGESTPIRIAATSA